MSLLRKNSPKKSKSKKNQVEPHNGVQPSSPKNKIQSEELISKYKFKLSDEKSIDSTNQNPLEEIKTETFDQVFAPPEQETIAQEEQTQIETFDLLDISFKCNWFLKFKLTQPQLIQVKKLEKIERQIIREKIEVFTKDYKIIELGYFKDKLYYLDGCPVVPEIFEKISGFLREFFNITHIYVIRSTGKLSLVETGFCDYWTKEKLENFMDLDLMEHMILDQDERCIRCPYNSLNKRI